jgi:hypothetical protein
VDVVVVFVGTVLVGFNVVVNPVLLAGFVLVLNVVDGTVVSLVETLMPGIPTQK